MSCSSNQLRCEDIVRICAFTVPNGKTTPRLCGESESWTGLLCWGMGRKSRTTTLLLRLKCMLWYAVERKEKISSGNGKCSMCIYLCEVCILQTPSVCVFNLVSSGTIFHGQQIVSSSRANKRTQHSTSTWPKTSPIRRPALCLACVLSVSFRQDGVGKTVC